MISFISKHAFVLGLLLVIVLALPLTVYLVGQRTSYFGLAGPTVVPQQVKITNISDNSFTVSWITPDQATGGFVAYGESDKLGNTASDDRDKQGVQDRYTHHVTLKNLDPSTVYYFKIGSGSKLYDDNGKPYTQQTAPTTSDSPPVADPSFGMVKGKTSQAAQDAIVYVTIAGGTPLSTHTSPNGTWFLALNNTRRSDLTTYLTYKPEGDSITIYVQGVNAETAQATTDTNNDNPVPDITLGNTYAFGKSGSTPVQESISSATTTPNQFSLQPITNVQESEIPLEVTSPKTDETVSSRPKFTGTGKPGEVITITIESLQTITDQVTVGSDGKWTYTPQQDLSDGSHKITVIQSGNSFSSAFQVVGATTPASSAPRASATFQPSVGASTLPKAGNVLVSLVSLIFGMGLVGMGIMAFQNKR